LPRTEGINRILIKVHPDCRVEVAAPVTTDDAELLAAVKKRGRWIYQQLRDFREQQKYVSPRKYISGESHYYLGKQYLLKVIESSDQPEMVKLTRGKLEVFVRSKSSERVNYLLTEWYRQKAKDLFSKRLDAMLDQALWVTQRPTIRVLTMKTQWGSCSPAGRLTLNPHLVKAPTQCIDYVILHELCHIAEHNHSKKFYRLMQQVMPQWEMVKIRLDNFASVCFS
jgi:predicted metal-dependent hydrolase